ncbi:MAG TPA: hypothetical protein VH743_13250 [Beijerinckiaceae bacterium]|jgi:hypothetical protein
MGSAYPEEAKNFRLLGHDASAAYGGGSLVEIAKGHAFVAAVGSSSYHGPEGFTIHDVRDPRKPRKVAEVKAPPGVHSHKLRLVGDDLLYVVAELLPGEEGKVGRPGMLIYDVSTPSQPRQVGFYDMPGSGPHRFGIDHERQLALVPCDAPDWKGRVIWTLDIRDPLKPEVVGIWGLPQQRSEGAPPTNEPRPEDDFCTLHGPPIIRGNRMFAGFWGGGVAIIDCSDLADMSLVGHVTWSPPFPGRNHTVCPIGDRPYMVVTDEGRAGKKFWDALFMWTVDIRDESNPVPIASFFPDRERYFNRPGRFGAHNIIEHIAADGPWANLVFLTYFNAGLRAVDVSDPLQPKEVGYYVPETPEGQAAIQSNDVGADEHGRLYIIDRGGAGMHIIEYTG